MNSIVNNTAKIKNKIKRINLYTALIQRISAIFGDHLMTFHVFKEVHML